LSKLDTDYVPKAKYQEIESEVKPAHEEKFFSEFAYEAQRNAKISDTAKGDKRFRRNLKDDFNDTLKKRNWSVDYKTGEVVDSEGLPALNGSNKITANDILEIIITDNEEYQKKSDGRPASGEIEVTLPKVNGNNPLNNPNYKNLMRQ
jgi:hypothetical protein